MFVVGVVVEFVVVVVEIGVVVFVVDSLNHRVYI